MITAVTRAGFTTIRKYAPRHKTISRRRWAHITRCQQQPGAALVEDHTYDDKTDAQGLVAYDSSADEVLADKSSSSPSVQQHTSADSTATAVATSHDGLQQHSESRGEFPTAAQADASQGTQELSLSEGIRKICSIAVPLSLQFVAGYGLTIIGALFIGRLGPEPLSVSVLASSIYNVAGLSVALGLSSGMETLCGQAFGAKDYKTLGLVLQRALLVCWLFCIPIVAGLFNSEHLLMHAGQQAEIAAGAAQYLRLLLPCLFTSTASECLRKYLLAQQVVRPTMVSTAIVTALAPAWYWLFVCKLGMGLTGAAYAYCCCHLTGLSLLAGYVTYRSTRMAGQATNTWGGFSRKAFQGWGEYLSYGVPTAIMICMEWWAYEVLILLAGALPSAQVSLAVMGICMNISTWVYMLPMALGSAVNTWVSNCLGAGDAVAARGMFRSGMALVVGLQTIIAGSLVLGGKHVAQVFCTDPVVVAVATQALPLVGALCFADGLNSVLGAVLRASGRQAWGAGINLVGYWLVGVPLGAYLGFTLGMGVQGFWLGVGTSAILQAAALGLLVARWDWQGEVGRAQKRLASGTFAAAGGH